MKCYYEELAVPRDASDADIKSAYRKLALRWHPDKNLECLEEAKEKFQLIQQAYEVLSDAHERAWYDNHREQILRGKNSEYVENCLDVYQYFTSSCFKGYGDGDKGFYAVYSEVFAKIAVEDAEFFDNEEEMRSIPKFGNSQSSYEEVVGPFYAYWSAYSTKKSYEWLCPYDIREIKDRRILREVEKDLKKITTKARKERNEEIRNLVSFVRKRDRRVHAYRQLLQERAEENRVKQEKYRIEKIRKRQKELQEIHQNTKLPGNDEYEEQLKNLEQQYGVDGGDDSDSQEDTDDSNSETVLYDNLYCIACNKSFKNDKAFANHETSKKHRERAEKLREEMDQEEKNFNNSCENEITNNDIEESSAPENEESQHDNLMDDHLISNEPSDKAKNNTPSSEIEHTDAEDDLSMEDLDLNSEDESIEDHPIKNVRNNKRNKKNKKPPNRDNLLPKKLDEEDNLDEHLTFKDSSDDEDWNTTSSKKGNKKSKTKKSNSKSVNNVTKPTKATQSKELSTDVKDEETLDKTATTKSSGNDEKVVHMCATCKAVFPSNNKLFMHLKSTKHSVYIPKDNLASKTEVTQNRKSKSKHK